MGRGYEQIRAVFDFSVGLLKRFDEGDPFVRKEIMTTIGSNLSMSGRIVALELKKPFKALQNGLTTLHAVSNRLEPTENGVGPARNGGLNALRSSWRGIVDDVRTCIDKERRVLLEKEERSMRQYLRRRFFSKKRRTSTKRRNMCQSKAHHQSTAA
jgi:hypothetical protein